MNFLEKALIKKLLDPKNIVSGDGCVSIQLGALKTLPPDFVPLLPLAEKCLGALPGISGVTADAAGGKVTIRYESGRLDERDVIAWYRLVLGETLNETDRKHPKDMTEADAQMIARRALTKMGL